MKRLLWIPLFFLCSTLWAAEPVQLARMNPYIAGAGVSAAATPCSGSDTEFGQTTNGDTEWQIGSDGASYMYFNVKHAAPGSGAQRLCSMSGYAKSAGGTPGNISMALYDMDAVVPTKVCETTEQKAVTSTSYSWLSWDYTKLKPVDGVAGDQCTVWGGKNYRFAISQDANDVTFYFDTGTDGDGFRNIVDSTAGFLTWFTRSTATSAKVYLKGGVQSGATTGTEILGHADIGTSNAATNTGYIRCGGRFTVPANGHIDRVYIYSANSNAAQDVKIGLYTDSSGPASPVTGSPTTFDDVGTWSASWKEFTVDFDVSADAAYWACYEISTSSSWTQYYSTLIIDGRAYVSSTYGNAWPDPMSESRDTTSESIKVRYSF